MKVDYSKNLNLFDLEKGELLKERGQTLAEQKNEDREELVKIARDCAKKIAQERLDRRLTVDSVYYTLLSEGYNPELLGNAWGTVFREKCWRFTGEWKKSTRTSNHARAVRVWELRF